MEFEILSDLQLALLSEPELLEYIVQLEAHMRESSDTWNIREALRAARKEAQGYCSHSEITTKNAVPYCGLCEARLYASYTLGRPREWKVLAV